MVENLIGLVVLLMLSVLIAFIVYFIIYKSLQTLLNEVLKLPSGTTFYTRLLFTGLLFISFSSALDIKFDLDKEAHTIEYIWKIAEGLSSAFAYTCFFITLYLLLITILIGVLRRHHD